MVFTPLFLFCIAYYNLFPQRFKHLVDTTFLLFYIRVNIEVECCGDVGMAKQHADSLIVAVTLYAASGEAVAQSMIFQLRDAKFLQKSIVVVAVCAWFCRLFLISQHIEILVHHLF